MFDDNMLKGLRNERDVDILVLRFEKEIFKDGRIGVDEFFSDACRTLFKSLLLYMIEVRRNEDDMTWENFLTLLHLYPVVKDLNKRNLLSELFESHKMENPMSNAYLCFEIFMMYPYKSRYAATIYLMSIMEECFAT